MKIQRSMMIFEQTCKDEATLTEYRSDISEFLKLSKIKNYDSLVQESRNRKN